MSASRQKLRDVSPQPTCCDLVHVETLAVIQSELSFCPAGRFHEHLSQSFITLCGSTCCDLKDPRGPSMF